MRIIPSAFLVILYLWGHIPEQPRKWWALYQQPVASQRPPQVQRIPSVEEGIIKFATELGISAHMPLAIVWRESGFDPYAISKENRDHSRDFGLFQLNSRYFNLGTWALNPHLNTIIGLSHWKACLDRCGSEQRALHAYAHWRCE